MIGRVLHSSLARDRDLEESRKRLCPNLKGLAVQIKSREEELAVPLALVPR